MDVSGGGWKTISGVGESFVSLVVSDQSHVVPEWRRGRFSWKLGPQPWHSWLYCSVRPAAEVRSRLPICSSREVACLLLWLYSNVSLWGCLCFHMFHTVSRQFLTFCHFLSFLGLELSASSLLILPVLALFPSVPCFCVIVLSEVHQELPNFLALIPFRGVSQSVHADRSPVRLFNDFFRRGGILSYMNCSLIRWAAFPKVYFAQFWSSSKKSINFCFARLTTSRWNSFFLP